MTKKELKAIKEEVETVNKKLHELTEEELEQVTGGIVIEPKESLSDTDTKDPERPGEKLKEPTRD